MKIHNVTQGSPEWHALRARCRNASELAAVRGRSKYQKRTDLIRIKATGITPDIDDATQRLFDRGHEAEAKARAIVEQMIGEDLYPVVATTDDEYLLASSDGSNMLGSIGFEHKLLSESLVAQILAGQLDPHYTDQMDQQFAVFGFEKIIFACSDGTPENFYSMEYTGNPESIARIRADWAQFDEDVANYQHVETKTPVVGKVTEDFPAVFVQVSGSVSIVNNLRRVGEAIDEFLEHKLIRKPKSDQDFADLEGQIKMMKKVEDALDSADNQVVAQVPSVEEFKRDKEAMKALVRDSRLAAEKIIKMEKESRKLELVRDALQEFYTHCAALEKRVGVNFTFAGPNFAEAIKGLKTIDSMRDKLSAALANGKVDASAIADRIEANRKTVEDMSLLPDFAQVCTKAPEDFAALLAMRVAQRKAAEEKRLEQERERIRAEEQAKAQREANEKAAEEIRRLDAERKAADQPAVVTESLTTATASIEPANDSVSTIKLGEICTRLGFNVTADFLASLGIAPVATEKNAKLYPAAKFPTICRLISDHVMALAFKKAA